MRENAAQLLLPGHEHAVLKTGPGHRRQMNLDRVSSTPWIILNMNIEYRYVPIVICRVLVPVIDIERFRGGYRLRK